MLKLGSPFRYSLYPFFVDSSAKLFQQESQLIHYRLIGFLLMYPRRLLSYEIRGLLIFHSSSKPMININIEYPMFN